MGWNDYTAREVRKDGELRAKSREIAALKAELYDALTTVLCHCSCDGEYDCDRCEANLERRRQLKQEGE